MIPYDDLVAALSAWRARQGLPVSTMGGGPAPGSGPHPQPGSGPYGKPGSGPQAKPGSGPQAKPPLEEPLAVDDAEMLEEYENEGDFGMQFGNSSGATPPRPPATDNGNGRGGRGGRGDW